MATRKTAAAAEVEEVKTEAETEEVKTETEENEDPISEWDKKKKVYVPRARKGEDQNAYVCVNDRRFSIPRNGQMQEMPLPIAEALEESIQAELKAAQYAESIQVHEPKPGELV